ncbi:NPD-domain-containing protein [Lentinula lateritia]|uniref:NPD-domain-containing protein n=1 Tax=Lentinula aff. lateritia TaxID=2804960 RepID=A0ACC1TWT7_9AGAR|nr:NPD-domain-containing protein [Lentinula aff. lateritia]KAJ3850535.1 NPD-domain-containing protein [Lentinula lateritia]
MAGASGGALAAQVTNGGGFGFISAGYQPAEALISELSLARSLLETKRSTGILPVGVGYLGWLLDRMPPEESETLLIAALSANVQAFWFAFGRDLGKWIQYVRDKSPEKCPLIFVQVNSLDEAVHAVEYLEADVIVAQGIESGGHGGSYAPPLSELLQSILAQFAGSSQGPCILAAGGLANGSDIALQLGLGAAGAVMGTRFLLSPESKYTDAQREALIAARSEDTVRTMAFDQARGTIDWPEGIDGRGLRNDTVSDFEQGVSLELIQSKFKEGIQNQDHKRFLVWAGTGVGSMNRTMPAKDIVKELHQECEQQFKLFTAQEVC